MGNGEWGMGRERRGIDFRAHEPGAGTPGDESPGWSHAKPAEAGCVKAAHHFVILSDALRCTWPVADLWRGAKDLRVSRGPRVAPSSCLAG